VGYLAWRGFASDGGDRVCLLFQDWRQRCWLPGRPCVTVVEETALPRPEKPSPEIMLDDPDFESMELLLEPLTKKGILKNPHCLVQSIPINRKLLQTVMFPTTGNLASV
ncbi:hypothetical protein JRQ81_000604, partial [Phrynocephalus forsythii]